MKIKITADGSIGGYDVTVDGVKVGEVRKMTQHYNLARPCTVTYWIALPVGKGSDGYHYRARRDAVAALTEGIE